MDRLSSPINDLLFGLREFANKPGVVEVFNTPRLDVDKGKDKTLIRIGLPGVSPEDLNVEVDNHTISVSVVKEETTESEDGESSQKRAWFAGWKQTFPLSKDVDTENVTAELKDGLLTLVLPVSEEKKSRKIEVKR